MTGTQGSSAESIIREIKRQTCRKLTAEENIRIVLEGPRDKAGIADLCRKVGIHPTMYYNRREFFISESTVYRILKAYDLITSPVLTVVSANLFGPRPITP